LQEKDTSMMNSLTVIFVLMVAAEHLYIMFLETFATTSRHTSKTFSIDVEELSNHHISTLLKNQGVYNGLLAVLLTYAAISQNLLWSRLLLGYVILVALFGAWSSDPKILFKQGGLAIVAMAVSFMG
jgi:putative membrane protein